MKARGGIWRARHPWLANVLAGATAACLVGFGVYGVVRDDLPVPSSLRYGNPHRYFHLHGAAAWLMAAGLVCSGVSMAIVVWRRLTAKPGAKIDQRAAIIIAMAGFVIIMGMMVLTSFGVV